MVAHKGGKCVGCGLIATDANLENLQFDHKDQVQNAHDKSDRWGGAVRDWQPFTDQWIAWAVTVDLVCPRCHYARHHHNKQMSFADFEVVQARLDDFDPGTIPVRQPDFFGEAR